MTKTQKGEIKVVSKIGEGYHTQSEAKNKSQMHCYLLSGHQYEGHLVGRIMAHLGMSASQSLEPVNILPLLAKEGIAAVTKLRTVRWKLSWLAQRNHRGPNEG